MRKNSKLIGLITIYAAVTIFIMLFYMFNVINSMVFFVLAIGSVAVISTSTIVTAIHHQSIEDERLRDTQFKPKQKVAKKMESVSIIEDYLDALPSTKDYIESDKSYKDIPVIEKLIFSELSSEEIYKINLLDLSKKEKLLFIREMLYYESEERETLIDTMLKSKGKVDHEVIYSPVKPVELNGQIRVHIISLIEPGEKMKIMIIQKTDSIESIKEKIGIMFNYDFSTFLLSSGGILLKENTQIQDYNIEEDDEIVLIPIRI